MPLRSKGMKKFKSFDFGVSYRIGESRERFRDALNVFSNQGRLETRFGRSRYIDTLLSGPVLSLSYFKTGAGVRYVLAKVGTSLYSISSSGAHTAIKTGLSSTTKHRGITWSRGSTSRHIIAIENDGLFQWDGTNFTILGEDPPVGFSIAATTGSLTGSYRVHLTYYSSTTGFETNSSFSNTIALVGQGINITGIPTTSANATINKIRVYLEDLGSPDDPLFVTEFALGTTSYSFGAEPDSTETRPLSNAKPVSGGGKFLAEFNGRLVYSGNNSFRSDVYFSEQDLPDAFNDGNGPDQLIYYANGDGPVTGIAVGLYNNTVLDPYLVVFKARSIDVFSGIAGEEKSAPISKQIGCVSHETIRVKNGDVYFLSDNGWRVISNGRLLTDQQNNPVTLGVGDIDDIFRSPGFSYEINKAQASNAFSVYYSTLDQYLTWVPEGASTSLSKTYCYEFKNGSFKPFTFNTASTAACTGEDSTGAEVVFMGDSNGAIYTYSVKEEKGSDANELGVAQAVTAYALLPWLDGDDMDRSYNWRNIILRRVVGSGDLILRGFVNFSLDSFADPFTYVSSSGGFQLDVSRLDIDELQEEGRTIERVGTDINQVGQNLMIGFYQNTIGSSMGLVAAQVEYSQNGNQN
jgi:hypothetical protein